MRIADIYPILGVDLLAYDPCGSLQMEIEKIGHVPKYAHDEGVVPNLACISRIHDHCDLTFIDKTPDITWPILLFLKILHLC